MSSSPTPLSGISPLTKANLDAHNEREQRQWFQFGCPGDAYGKTCEGALWWRFLPPSRPSSRCRMCRKAYKALPLDQVIGYGRFKCENPDCGREWGNHRSMYKYRQPCRTCGLLTSVDGNGIGPRIELSLDQDRSLPTGKREHHHECESCMHQNGEPGSSECAKAPVSQEGGDGSVTVLVSPGHAGIHLSRVQVRPETLTEIHPGSIPKPIAEEDEDGERGESGVGLMVMMEEEL